MAFLDPDRPLFPFVGILQEEPSCFGIVVQVITMNDVDSQDDVDSKFFDQHEVVGKGSASHLNGEQVSSAGLEQAPIGCFEDPKHVVKQPWLQVFWNLITGMQPTLDPVSYSPTNPVREIEIGRWRQFTFLFAKKWISCFT